jgi:hypothetical protein
VSLSCTDGAGNSGSGSASFQYDATNPGISFVGQSPAKNGYLWNNSNVTLSWNCTDNLSGAVSSPVTQVVSTEGAHQQRTGTCDDAAGNSASSTNGDVNLDKTAPSLGIADNNAASSSACGAKPTKPGFSPSDTLSGLDGSEGETWTTPATPSGAGTYTYSAHAQDKAGNSSSYGPKTYAVLYGTAFGGFLQPINSDGSSRFKLGSTIPVKFQALCNGVPVGNVVAKMYVVKGDNQPDPGVDEAISTAAATTGNLFRYTGAPDNQYIFNLSTKLGYTNPDNSTISSFSQGSWTLKIGLDDGTFRSINIQLVK